MAVRQALGNDLVEDHVHVCGRVSLPGNARLQDATHPCGRRCTDNVQHQQLSRDSSPQYTHLSKFSLSDRPAEVCWMLRRAGVSQSSLCSSCVHARPTHKSCSRPTLHSLTPGPMCCITSSVTRCTPLEREERVKVFCHGMLRREKQSSKSRDAMGCGGARTEENALGT